MGVRDNFLKSCAFRDYPRQMGASVLCAFFCSADSLEVFLFGQGASGRTEGITSLIASVPYRAVGGKLSERTRSRSRNASLSWIASLL